MNKNNISVFAERGEDGNYIINFPQKADYKVYKGVSAEDFVASSGESLTMPCPFPQERCVFAVTQGDASKKFYVSEKLIPMQGTPNFRDLGGIVNKHGNQIKWGKIFRSGMLSRLTETDLEYFKTLQIKTVIDFRSVFEAEREPEKFPKNYKLNYVSAPVGNPADFSRLMKCLENKQNAEDAVCSLMMQGASGFADAILDFKPLFDSMLKDDFFLFHCSAGKDRTGLAAALILSLLDVDREVILEDYMLSNKYTIPYFTKYISVMTDMGISKDIAIAASGVKREFLEKTLNTIDEKYGSFDNMLLNEFGIDSKIKSSFIEKYTY